MSPHTLTAIRAIVTADPSIDAPTRARIMAAITKPGSVVSPTPHDRIVRRAEAASMLGRSTRCLDYWAKAGLISPVKLPGSTRGGSFRLSDIQALIAGKGGDA